MPQDTSDVPKTSDVPDVPVGLSAFGNVTAMCSDAAASLGESGLPPSLTTQIKANRQLALERKASAEAMWRLRVLLLGAELHHMVSFFNHDKEEMETVLTCALHDDRVLQLTNAFLYRYSLQELHRAMTLPQKARAVLDGI